MKKALFWFLWISFLLALPVVILLGVDLYLHHKLENSAGLNYRGYRGKVLGKKTFDEKRAVVVGGSTAFGYGVKHFEAFPAYLEEKLNVRANDEKVGTRFSIANLGINNSGSYAFLPDLKHYQSLDYDLAIFYEGYNDMAENHSLFRWSSPVFRLTGYLPIFPSVFHEKAMAIRYGGDLEAAYVGKKTVFRPGAAKELLAKSLDGVANATLALQDRLGDLKKMPTPKNRREVDLNLSTALRFYCENVAAALDYVLSQNKKVMIVTQPYISPEHKEQQRALVAYLEHEFAAKPGWTHVNLGEAIDLKKSGLAFDGMHLVAEGNRQIAAQLTGPVWNELVGKPNHLTLLSQENSRP